MNLRTVLACGLGALTGLLALAATLWLSIGLAGAGHNRFSMPHQALHAPNNLYPLVWPVLMGAAFCGQRIIRRIVGWMAVAQVVTAMFLFLAKDGLGQTMAHMAHGSGVAWGVSTLIAIYVGVTLTLLLAGFWGARRGRSAEEREGGL